MESTLLEEIQSEEVMTKHWDCKLLCKEEEDGPEIDLLDYVNLSEEEEDKIPKNSSYPNFCLNKFHDRINGLEARRLAQVEEGTPFIWNSRWALPDIKHCKTLACGKNYHVACYHYQLYKEKVNLKKNTRREVTTWMVLQHHCEAEQTG
jgi:hypothetical protein